MEDEIKANGLIEGSSNVRLAKGEFWYDYDNQRKHIFNVAVQLKINDASLSDNECVEQAKNFVEIFRQEIIIKKL